MYVQSPYPGDSLECQFPEGPPPALGLNIDRYIRFIIRAWGGIVLTYFPVFNKWLVFLFWFFSLFARFLFCCPKGRRSQVLLACVDFLRFVQWHDGVCHCYTIPHFFEYLSPFPQYRISSNIPPHNTAFFESGPSQYRLSSTLPIIESYVWYYLSTVKARFYSILLSFSVFDRSLRNTNGSSK